MRVLHRQNTLAKALATLATAHDYIRTSTSASIPLHLRRASMTTAADCRLHRLQGCSSARQIFVMTMLLVAVACHGKPIGTPSVETATARRIANLHAFARLYGVVRWFHPSDAASAIEWDRLAV